MSTAYSAYAEAADTSREASNVGSFATASGGSGNYGDASDASLYCGAMKYGTTYYVDLMYLPFDTSDLPDNAVVLSATLRMYGTSDQSVTDFIIEVGAYDWGTTTVTSEHWQDPTEIAGIDILATLDTSGFLVNEYNVFSDAGDGLASVVNVGGMTRLLAWPQRQRTGSAPTTGDYVMFASSEGGDGKRPWLLVNYEIPALASPPSQSSIHRVAFPSSQIPVEEWGVRPRSSRLIQVPPLSPVGLSPYLPVSSPLSRHGA